VGGKQKLLIGITQENISVLADVSETFNSDGKPEISESNIL
jgi:flagellar biogenesis protein FliO